MIDRNQPPMRSGAPIPEPHQHIWQVMRVDGKLLHDSTGAIAFCKVHGCPELAMIGPADAEILFGPPPPIIQRIRGAILVGSDEDDLPSDEPPIPPAFLSA